MCQTKGRLLTFVVTVILALVLRPLEGSSLLCGALGSTVFFRFFSLQLETKVSFSSKDTQPVMHRNCFMWERLVASHRGRCSACRSRCDHVLTGMPALSVCYLKPGTGASFKTIHCPPSYLECLIHPINEWGGTGLGLRDVSRHPGGPCEGAGGSFTLQDINT